MKGLFLTLFIATAAFAQPVVGPEVTTPPLPALGDVSLAPQRDGFVIAWEQAGRIHAARLDGTLQTEGAALELPLLDPGATASSPAIATNGTSVLVAWNEQHAGFAPVNVVATLSAVAQTVLHGPQMMNLTSDPPIAASAGGEYVVYSGELKFRFAETLVTESLDGIPSAMTAAISTSGDVATAKHSEKTQSFSCIPFGFGGGDCDNFPLRYTFVLPGRVVSQDYRLVIKQGATVSLPPPLIAPNGNSFAALLRLPSQTDVMLFGSQSDVRQTLPATILTEAAIAGNGSNVLVVWTGPPLKGIVIDSNGRAAAPFTISQSSIDRPKVVAAGSNDFVVFYRIDIGSGQKALAGRIVRLQPARRRATK